MGRIKSTLIKKTARKLSEEKFAFSEDFNNNKTILSNTLPSKKMRNKIAGYISRIKKFEKTDEI